VLATDTVGLFEPLAVTVAAVAAPSADAAGECTVAVGTTSTLVQQDFLLFVEGTTFQLGDSEVTRDVCKVPKTVVASLLLKSGGSSVWCGSVLRCGAWRVDHATARLETPPPHSKDPVSWQRSTASRPYRLLQSTHPVRYAHTPATARGTGHEGSGARVLERHIAARGRKGA
jgi:hypothetical protein